MLPQIQTSPAVLRVNKIHQNPLNVRQVPVAQRKELADSLLRQGQLFPIWVRPHPEIAGEYELVDGERRWWGAQEAGLLELRAEIGDWTDEHVVVIALTTGTQQAKLNPIAEARGVAWLLSRPGATQESVAEQIGFSQQHVARLVKVLSADAAVIRAVEEGQLPMTTAFLIAGLENRSEQAACAAEVIAPPDEPGPLSVERTKLLIKAKYGRPVRVPVAMEGQVALSEAENARVFPYGETEPDPAFGYVIFTKPIPADLLKPEVASGPKVKFSDLAEVSDRLVVYVAIDGAGRPVQLVKLAEVLAAVQPEDRHIFREDVARSAGVPKAKAQEAPSRRVEEEVAERERKKAAAAAKKREKEVVAWLAQLYRSLADCERLKLRASYSLWVLIFDLHIQALTPDDIRVILAAVADEELDAESPPAEQLNEVAMEIPAAALGALTTLMMLTPRVRAEGIASPLVKEWHEAVAGGFAL